MSELLLRGIIVMNLVTFIAKMGTFISLIILMWVQSDNVSDFRGREMPFVNGKKRTNKKGNRFSKFLAKKKNQKIIAATVFVSLNSSLP